MVKSVICCCPCTGGLDGGVCGDDGGGGGVCGDDGCSGGGGGVVGGSGGRGGSFGIVGLSGGVGGSGAFLGVAQLAAKINIAAATPCSVLTFFMSISFLVLLLALPRRKRLR